MRLGLFLQFSDKLEMSQIFGGKILQLLLFQRRVFYRCVDISTISK